jgi:hypothetical protein
MAQMVASWNEAWTTNPWRMLRIAGVMPFLRGFLEPERFESSFFAPRLVRYRTWESKMPFAKGLGMLLLLSTLEMLARYFLMVLNELMENWAFDVFFLPTR